MELNTHLQEIQENLNRFIENINCLRDTFGFSEGTLVQQVKDAEKEYNDFIRTFNRNIKTNELDVPLKFYRDYLKRLKQKRRAERASVLIPPSYLISLVSSYDLFYAELIRIIYRIIPEKLLENEKSFTYRDLSTYKSVQEVRTLIIEETIEGLLRDSHIKQFEWLEKAMGVQTLKRFDEWPIFVELTERRNLFVHSDGMVSQQYIDVCSNHDALTDEVRKGAQLKVDKDYFLKAYNTLYIVGIKLTQMLAHTIYDKQFPNDHSSIDFILINNVYELISEELYDIAISVSHFALNNKHFKHNGNDRGYIILNLAQAYKWKGQNEKCIEILKQEDCTAWRDELLIPKFTLEGKYDTVYEKMKNVGRGSDILTPENYRQWPIFKEIRKEDDFINLFHFIFGEDLSITLPIKTDENQDESEQTLLIG